MQIILLSFKLYKPPNRLLSNIKGHLEEQLLKVYKPIKVLNFSKLSR